MTIGGPNLEFVRLWGILVNSASLAALSSIFIFLTAPCNFSLLSIAPEQFLSTSLLEILFPSFSCVGHGLCRLARLIVVMSSERGPSNAKMGPASVKMDAQMATTAQLAAQSAPYNGV